MSANDNPFALTITDKSRDILKVDDITLEVLKLHFDSTIMAIDPYIVANLSAMINMSFTDVCDVKKMKSPSNKQIIRIHNIFEKRLKLKYGKYFDVLNFNYKNRNSTFGYSSNIFYSYKHSKGILYGHSTKSYLSQLYYTTHSLDRFLERVNEDSYKKLSFLFKQKFSSTPTPNNILDMISEAAMSWGTDHKYYYLNVLFGVLVLEPVGNLFVCLTFLSSDMVKCKKHIDWYVPIKINLGLEYGYQLNNLSDMFNHKSDLISEPKFYNDDEKFGEQIIEKIRDVFLKTKIILN